MILSEWNFHNDLTETEPNSPDGVSNITQNLKILS